MKTKWLPIAYFFLAPICAFAQDSARIVAPVPSFRVWSPNIEDHCVIQRVAEISIAPQFYTTKRERDSIRILDLRDLLAMDHVWVSRNVCRLDSSDGMSRQSRITLNTLALRSADSAFREQYPHQLTNR